jgi:hypothetical protein
MAGFVLRQLAMQIGEIFSATIGFWSGSSRAKGPMSPRLQGTLQTP